MKKPTEEFVPPAPAQPCPCGTGKKFAECCQPVLKQQRKPATAEELMRSRFTAHVARDYEHLHRTYLESSREPYVSNPDPNPPKWTRLEILAHEKGVRPEMAYVDFIAYHQGEKGEEALHEKAEFKLIDGAWLYTRPVRQGPAPAKSSAAEIGRNDPCTCGSGKKYKKCHGK